MTVVDRGSDARLCIVQPWGMDATSTALSLGLDPARTVAVDPVTPFELRRTLMLTAVTAPEVRDLAHALLACDGVPVTLINDSGGFIAQRVMATIVNIAANIVQRFRETGLGVSPRSAGLGRPHRPGSNSGNPARTARRHG
jgi:3-hydroxybutyryl-CoA dehydrogenase